MKVRELVERLRREGYSDDQYWVGSDATWCRHDECHCLRVGPPVWESFYSERGQANSKTRFDNEDTAAAEFYRGLARFGPRRRRVASLTHKVRAERLLQALLAANVEATLDTDFIQNFSKVRYRIFVPGVAFQKALEVRARVPSGWIPRGWDGES